MAHDWIKLSDEDIRQALSYKDAATLRRELEALQVAVYVMAGGGWIGHFAAQQPKDFYIDQRVARRPYPTKAIYQAVRVLRLYAEMCGLNPSDLPPLTNFHNCGIF